MNTEVKLGVAKSVQRVIDGKENYMKKTKAMLSAAMIVVGAVLCAGWGCGPAAKSAPAAPAARAVVRGGEYCSKDEVAKYIRQFGGALPKNFITKAQARARGWSGGPLEPFAPGKSIDGARRRHPRT